MSCFFADVESPALALGFFVEGGCVLYYGLKSHQQARQMARQVTEAFNGEERHFNMLVETACAETLLGTYPDKHAFTKGVGLCQHDQIAIDDIQQQTDERHIQTVKNVFGYDIRKIQLADLALDPLLSIICCRLVYLRKPEHIPDDLKGRAQYWKEHYNTAAGKGSEQEYLERVAEVLGEEWQ